MSRHCCWNFDRLALHKRYVSVSCVQMCAFAVCLYFIFVLADIDVALVLIVDFSLAQAHRHYIVRCRLHKSILETEFPSEFLFGCITKQPTNERHVKTNKTENMVFQFLDGLGCEKQRWSGLLPLTNELNKSCQWMWDVCVTYKLASMLFCNTTTLLLHM